MLTSRQNPLVKSFRKLHQPKFRKQSQTCLLEGTNLIEAALAHQYPLDVVCFTESWELKYPGLAQQLATQAQRLERVSEDVLDAIATTQHPDGVAATIPWPDTKDLPPTIEGVGLVLEGIQDPGNLGTILRSVSAAKDAGIGWGLVSSSDLPALGSRGSAKTLPISGRADCCYSSDRGSTILGAGLSKTDANFGGE